MEQTKKKITQTVRDYIKLFPQEYDAFLKGHKEKVDMLDDKFAQAKGADMILRALFEVPETLYKGIEAKLTPEELEWFRALGNYEKNFSGPKWFIKTFPQFKTTHDF